MIKKIAPSILMLTTLTGCLSTAPQMTAEERSQMIEMQKSMLGAMMGGANLRQQAPQAPTQAPVEYLSELELMEQRLLVNATGGPALFVRNKDGILINGKMFNDFEGSVANLGADRFTGQFTYAIKNFDGSYTLKYHKANSEQEPIKIANIIRKGDLFSVETVTGKKTSGNAVIPTSDGFILGRAGSAFRYKIGEGNIENITLIDDYHIAQHQNGDAASTGYILLEKDARDKSDSVGGLFDSVSALGSTFGLNELNDYVLVNIEDGSLVPLDISLLGKNVTDHSDCRASKSGLYNECDKVSFREALYDKNGLKNNSHYYWSIDWINTSSGVFAFYKTTTTIKVVDIQNSLVHTVFSRMLGVNEFTLTEHANGKVSIEAQLGFSHEKIEDVEEFIRSNKENAEQMTKMDQTI